MPIPNSTFVNTSKKVLRGGTSSFSLCNSAPSFLTVMFLLLIVTAPFKAETQNLDERTGAATTSKSDSVVSPTTEKNVPPDIYDIVKVSEVYNLQYKDSRTRDRKCVLEKRKASLNDIIIVKVEKLEALLKRSKCQIPYDQPPCREREISLYLDGRIIRGLKPESGAPTLEKPKAVTPKESASATNPSWNFLNGTLRYHLQRDILSSEDQVDNREHWADLLGLGADALEWSLKRQVDVSVGLADEYPVRTDVASHGGRDMLFYLVRMRTFWLWFWVIFTLAFLCFLYLLVQKSDILRDRAPVLWGQRKPYSLSAFQAAWWFILIIISFIFIWVVTGQYDLSGTALALLGIALGTGLGATVIDSNKREAGSDPKINNAELNILLSDKEKLEKQLPQKKSDYDLKIAEIKEKFPNAIGPAHEKFYLDILSDAGGVSFHRFQMFVWTVVLGIFFVYSVLSRLAMPQFTDTLLALIGISAGTYLGFKIPEKNNVATQETTPTVSGDSGEKNPS